MQTLRIVKGMQVLVNGGAGFIGSHLVDRLLSLEAAVTVLDSLRTGSLENLQLPRVAFMKADINESNWPEILAAHPFDVIFHYAANAYVPPSVEDPLWDCRLNLQGTLGLLEGLRKSKWPGVLVYASSAAVYGNPVSLPIREEDPTVPVSPYGVGKLAAERYVSVYSRLYGLRAASLRIFSCYGPRQCKQVVYDLVQKISADPERLMVHGDGTQLRDFCFVQDCVSAALTVCQNGPLAGEVYNVASGESVSIRELVDGLCRVMQVTPRIEFTGEKRPADAEKWVADIGRLRALGYRPVTRPEEGLRQTVAWARATLQAP